MAIAGRLFGVINGESRLSAGSRGGLVFLHSRWRRMLMVGLRAVENG